MQDSSNAILKEIQEITSKWEVRPNGNHYNSKISATIYQRGGDWKFVHDGQQKKGQRPAQIQSPFALQTTLSQGRITPMIF